MKILKKNTCKIFILFLLLGPIACKKKTDTGSPIIGGKTTLIVNANVSDFNQGDDISYEPHISPSKAHTITNKTDYLMADTIIALNDDYDLEATLTTESSQFIGREIQLSTKRAASTPLGTAIYYKLIVYNSDGSFKAERTYERGDESSTEALTLDGGVTYSFVAYSINSTSLSALNSIAPSFASSTLATSNLNITSNVDLLVFKQNVTISGEANDYLTILFKHQFNRMIVNIDASETEYEIESPITIDLEAPSPVTSYNLNTNSTTTSGASRNTTLAFQNAATNATSTASPVIFTTTSSNFSLSISNLTIGTLSNGSVGTPTIISFNRALTLGTSYNLTLKIKPIDTYLTHEGQSAVRINGKIWMRHNLRNDMIYSSTPDIAGQSIQGDYYQWGRNISFATGISNHQNTTTTNFSTTPITDASTWNLGTELNPEKNTANDPCPEHYRIPTDTEIRHIVSNTNYSFFPTNPVAGVTNYNSIGHLVSKRKKSVQASFPAQGFYQESASIPYIILGVVDRGLHAFAQSSYLYTSDPTQLNGTLTQFSMLYIHANAASRAVRPSPLIYNTLTGHPVRCIAE